MKIQHRLRRRLFSVFLVLIAISVSTIAYGLISELDHRTENTLKLKSQQYLKLLDERVSFVKTRCLELSKNDIIVNSLIDTVGRENYLPSTLKACTNNPYVNHVSVVNSQGKTIDTQNSNRNEIFGCFCSFGSFTRCNRRY